MPYRPYLRKKASKVSEPRSNLYIDNLHDTTQAPDFVDSSHLIRRLSDPLPNTVRASSPYPPPPPTTPAMKRSARITFSNAGTQPPVFVAGTLTAWEPMEMTIALERNKDGDLVFYKEFEEVEEGEHQYKFRLGTGDWWVTDDNAPKADDGSGNVNNLLAVKGLAVNIFGEVGSGPSSPTSPHAPNRVQNPVSTRSGPESPPTESNSAPFIVVESVPSKDRPDYGDVEGGSLHEDTGKRAADPQPDIKYELPPSPAEQRSAPAPNVPALVVEKTDERPAHGEDFGPEATPGQKKAHEKRAADAEPDEVIVMSDSSDSKSSQAPAPGGDKDDATARPDTPEEDRAPLFRHESTEDLDEAPLLPHERAQEEEHEPPHAAPDEPVKVEGGIPLFSHELPPHSSRSSARSKSSTSLKEMMEQEDFDDPSLETFPTRKEDIYMQLQQVKARLPEDEDARDSSPPSPRASRLSSNVNLAHSLSPIDEDEADSTAAGLGSVAANSPKDHQEQSIPESTEVDGEHRHKAAEGPIISRSEDNPESDELGAPSEEALPTPPQTPIEGKDQRQDSVTDTTVPTVGSGNFGKHTSTDVDFSNDDTRKLSSNSFDEAVATSTQDQPSAQQQKQKTYLENVIRILFTSWLGPLGSWFARLCGGRRNATGVAVASTVAVMAAVAYTYLPSEAL